MKSLQDKVAIVTGVGQGIGKGVAVALAKSGASVAVVDINLDAANEAVKEIQEVGGKAIAVQCDISDRNAIFDAVKKTQNELGDVFILVNNAIAVRHTFVEDITEADLDLVLKTGPYASLAFMQACFPAMKEKGGRIFNFGSGGAVMGLPNKGAYAISKEGIRGLTKVAAVEWGQYGITVNNIMPSVKTPLFDEWFNGLSEAEQKREMGDIPMRRFGDAEGDIGAFIAFLSTDGGSYITGRSLHVDGGRSYYDR